MREHRCDSQFRALAAESNFAFAPIHSAVARAQATIVIFLHSIHRIPLKYSSQLHIFSNDFGDFRTFSAIFFVFSAHFQQKSLSNLTPVANGRITGIRLIEHDFEVVFPGGNDSKATAMREFELLTSVKMADENILAASLN